MFTANTHQHSKLYLQILDYFVNLFTHSGEFFEAHRYQSSIPSKISTPRRPASPPSSPPVLFLTYDSCLQIIYRNYTLKFTFYYTFIHICRGILTKQMTTNFKLYFICKNSSLVNGKMIGGRRMLNEKREGES